MPEDTQMPAPPTMAAAGPGSWTAPADRDRLALQAALDAARPLAQRNRLGQFATPPALARAVVEAALAALPPDQPIHFLDPAFGTGAFLSALLAAAPSRRLERLSGIETDRHYGTPAQALWQGSGLTLELADFTRCPPPPPGRGFTLIVCNPPYVRHHHLTPEDKLRLQALGERLAGVRLSGLAGLYAHFMVLADAWAAPDAVAAWLVPAEFMDVNYGRGLRDYLTRRVTLLRIHRFDPEDVQFGDALVSSAVLWWRHRPPPADHAVSLTRGGAIDAPRQAETVPAAALARSAKWSHRAQPPAPDAQGGTLGGVTLGELFTIRRGLATGDNRFFIVSADQAARHRLPAACLTPILPGPRHLDPALTVIGSDGDGLPILPERRFLIDCRLPETEVAERFPELWRYLQDGVPTVAERYLCRHRRPWFRQELRPPPPLLCSYMGRSGVGGAGPFRFVLNRSRATAANVWLLMYPRPALAAASAADPGLLPRLRDQLAGLTAAALTDQGRVYGGGLHKLEPRELARVPMPGVPLSLARNSGI